MNINIKAHFEAEKKKHQELVAKAITEKEKLWSDIFLKSAAQGNLTRDLQKKKDLLRENEAEGLDTAKLKDKIQELEPQIAKASEEIALLKEAEQQLKGLVQRSFEREDLMTSVLEESYACKEAVIVDGFEQAFKLLPVEVTQLDSAGRPRQCTISINQSQQLVLSVKLTNQHFWNDFRPKSLQWLPSPDANETEPEWQQFSNAPQTLSRHAKGTSERVRVFFDNKTAQFILSQKLKWQRRWKQRDYPHNEETQSFEDEFKDIAVPLEPKWKSYIEVENGELDLAKSYEDNPLLAQARSEVVSHTSSKPLFKESAEALTSVEILKTIKGEWDAFVNCPWSNEVSGVLALLKYHIENGERVRFWSGGFENQYGLRLRTRDHDWIVGELFIDKSLTAATPKATVKVHVRGHNQSGIASLGRLFLYVWRDRSEREQH